MRQPESIIVSHLFPEMLDSLVTLLSNLSTEAWARPTVCAGWSVKDVALHLLGVEVGILSRRRDRFSPSTRPIHSSAELVVLIDELNTTWVQATRRISPRLLCALLEFTGRQVCDYFQSLDPHALGDPVSWAGPEPAPVWLDLAREYTERWHHQQHIRDAVGKPGLKEPKFFTPVLDAFVRALPHTYRDVDAADGTLLALEISGQSGDRWFLQRENDRWNLYLGVAQDPHARTVIDEDIAWRLFTKGLGQEQARSQVTIVGHRSLGLKVLDMVSIIA